MRRSGSARWARGLSFSIPGTGEALDIDALVGRHRALGDQRVMSLLNDRHGDLVDRDYRQRFAQVRSRQAQRNTRQSR